MQVRKMAFSLQKINVGTSLSCLNVPKGVYFEDSYVYCSGKSLGQIL